MKMLRKLLDRVEPHFKEGGKLEKFYVIYEATDTILYTPGHTTKGKVHVRDALDLKRMMITVVFALMPCLLMAFYNTGFQANTWVANGGVALDTWQESLYVWMGYSYDPKQPLGQRDARCRVLRAHFPRDLHCWWSYRNALCRCAQA